MILVGAHLAEESTSYEWSSLVSLHLAAGTYKQFLLRCLPFASFFNSMTQNLTAVSSLSFSFAKYKTSFAGDFISFFFRSSGVLQSLLRRLAADSPSAAASLTEATED